MNTTLPHFCLACNRPTRGVLSPAGTAEIVEINGEKRLEVRFQVRCQHCVESLGVSVTLLDWKGE